MNETRKVIAVFDSLVASRDDIAFPSVRAWIRGLNEYETRGLEQQFPERGTVFFHVSTSENYRPQRNQVGLFSCVASPGQTAGWKVHSILRHLAKVVDYTRVDKGGDPFAFWEWLTGFKDSVPCNILFTQGVVYVQRTQHDLIGPFSVSPDGKLLHREQLHVYEGVSTVGVEISGRSYSFIDTELLPKGKTVILDPREAIHRRLKNLSKTGNVEWLSRAKAQELSTALAGVNVADGSEWVMNDIPRALESVVALGQFDEGMARQLLRMRGVADVLESVWKEGHEQVIKTAQEEVLALKAAAETVKQTSQRLGEEVGELTMKKGALEDALLQLQRGIEDAKIQATQEFNAEMMRLAQSPASLALLGAWVGGSKKASNGGLPIVRVKRNETNIPQAIDFKTAIFNNFKVCGLSPLIANEVALICVAAIAAGEPIVFKSLLADLLADAIVQALGRPVTVWADVPAGVLDPVDWSDLLPAYEAGCPIVLQNANRSDLSLVLGTLRPTILMRALGRHQPEEVIVLTLESSPESVVPFDFPFGPIIDDRILRFYPAKAASNFNAYSEYAKVAPTVRAVTAEEFAEIGDTVRQIPLLHLSAHESVLRRAYGALKICDECHGQEARLFFKYWCLSRCSPEDISAVLDAHKESWSRDKELMDLKEALSRNG